jgi:TonB family protein
LTGDLPAHLTDHHFGVTLRSYLLYQHLRYCGDAKVTFSRACSRLSKGLTMRWKSRVLGVVSTLGLCAVLILGAHAGQGQTSPSEGDRLARLAQQRLQEGKLTEPAADSASYYLNELKKGNSNHVAIEPISRELASKLIGRAEARRRDGQPAEGSRMQAQLSRAPVQVAPVPYPKRERPKVMVAQAKRISYVAPAYPRKALEEGLSGSVTVDFIVDAKGEPTELRIADAKPSGVFDRAALEAVKHWRYEPFMVDGVPTPVPNRAVMRFDPQNPERAWRGAP